MSNTPLPLTQTYAEALPEGVQSWSPAYVQQPTLLYANRALAEQLGLPIPNDDDTLAQWYSGNAFRESDTCVAQAYTGHQFGHLAPMLGDGRAVILGEWQDKAGKQWDLALKGSGRTPFSRGGDGKAALGPMLREVLISEAMARLGVPSTRSLAVVGTGETVYRQGPEPGAILTRTAASHIRIGTFEYFAHRQDIHSLKHLADYTIQRHYPNCAEQSQPYLALLDAIVRQQAALVAHWMSVGFIHGVMNTDNVALSGETIDYGPCAFMETYDPNAVFSSIDRQGRYAYANQPLIMQWNLARLAETLFPLLDGEDDHKIERLTETVHSFQPYYEQAHRQHFRQKLGIFETEEDSDAELIQDFFDLLNTQSVDFTLGFRRLCRAAKGDSETLQRLFADPTAVTPWLERWQQRLSRDKNNNSSIDIEQRALKMEGVNPAVIPRNHRVEEALTAADNGDLSLFYALLSAVEHPYVENEHNQRYCQPAANAFTQQYRTFCGT